MLMYTFTLNITLSLMEISTEIRLHKIIKHKKQNYMNLEIFVASDNLCEEFSH